MKNPFIRLLLFLAGFFLAYHALAQQCIERPFQVETHYLPVGDLCSLEGGEKLCFDFEESKDLLKLDHELFSCDKMLLQYAKVTEEQIIIIRQKDIIIATHIEDKAILQKQVDRLDGKWKQCLEEQGAFPWRGFLTGIGTGLLAGVVAGVSTWAIITAVSSKVAE